MQLELSWVAMTDDELDRLANLATEAFEETSPRLASWTRGSVRIEQRRRLINASTSPPIEADLPDLDLESWSSAELSGALIAASAFGRSHGADADGIGRFASCLSDLAIGTAAHRLKRA